MKQLNNLASVFILLVAIGCSDSSPPKSTGATASNTSPASPWTTIGEYDAGMVTSRPNKDDGGTDFVASKHFLGAMLKFICRHYGCTVIVDPPTLASRPIELTVTGDSPETVFQAIAEACQLRFSVGDGGQYIITTQDTSGDTGRSIAGDTFPPWWDQ
jgi:hypothetical protein